MLSTPSESSPLSPLSRVTKNGVLSCTFGLDLPTDFEGDDRRDGELGVGDNAGGLGVDILTLVNKGLGEINTLHPLFRMVKGDLFCSEYFFVTMLVLVILSSDELLGPSESSPL